MAVSHHDITRTQKHGNKDGRERHISHRQHVSDALKML